jgi:hypothetical protein
MLEDVLRVKQRQCAGSYTRRIASYKGLSRRQVADECAG